MRPTELDQLIEDLRAECPNTGVVAHTGSKMVVVLEENNQRLSFDQKECELLLSSPDSVERLFEALNYPEDVFVELHDLVLDVEVMSELESFASTVDEM